jgi:hypothetical protein
MSLLLLLHSNLSGPNFLFTFIFITRSSYFLILFSLYDFDTFFDQ